MIYKTLDDLCRAISDRMRHMPGDKLDAAAWLASDREMQRLSVLARVYFKALHNPPDGVIGVGAITYAENKLVDFQQ